MTLYFSYANDLKGSPNIVYENVRSCELIFRPGQAKPCYAISRDGDPMVRYLYPATRYILASVKR